MELKEVKKVKFKDLKVGTIFREPEYYPVNAMLKIEPIVTNANGFIVNAILLGNTKFTSYHFNDEQEVIDCIHSLEVRNEIFKELDQKLKELENAFWKIIQEKALMFLQ